MIRGLYTAAAGMIAENRREQMLTNNMNNANTPGYKSDQDKLRSFPETLIERLGGGTPASNVGDMATGVYVQETIPDFSEGTVSETGKATDVALDTASLPVNRQSGRQEGALFFAVQTAKGVRYTRDGHFTLDAQGYLADSNGNRVLDSNGRTIQLPSDNFKIDSSGNVTVSGQAIADLGVSYAADPNRLVKEGTGLFRLSGTNGALPSAVGNPNISYQVKQGFLEGSNVSVDETMTDMMSAYRSFEANQKVLQTLDGSLDKAVNQVGRIS